MEAREALEMRANPALFPVTPFQGSPSTAPFHHHSLSMPSSPQWTDMYETLSHNKLFHPRDFFQIVILIKLVEKNDNYNNETGTS